MVSPARMKQRFLNVAHTIWRVRSTRNRVLKFWQLAVANEMEDFVYPPSTYVAARLRQGLATHVFELLSQTDQVEAGASSAIDLTVMNPYQDYLSSSDLSNNKHSLAAPSSSLSNADKATQSGSDSDSDSSLCFYGYGKAMPSSSSLDKGDEQNSNGQRHNARAHDIDFTYDNT